MTNEEVQEIIDRAEDEYDRLKDRVHEQYDEIKRLNNIIKELREYIEKELGNVNTNENIIAKGICLKIKKIMEMIKSEC